MTNHASTSITDQIVNGLTSGVIAVGPHNEILAANPAAARHLNLPADALKPGTALSSLGAMTPLLESIREVAESRKPATRKEIAFQPGPNDRRELGFSITLLEGPADYNGVIILFTDMTERRKLERAASVNRQLASLGELAAGVVHQLRNPLTIISGRAQMLARQLKDDPGATESLQAVRDECARMSDSISRFLAFARPFEMKPGPATAEAVVRRAFELNRKKAEDANIALNSAVPDLAPLWIDQLRLAEALGNIVDNAIDAIDANGTIEIDVSQKDGKTTFEIRDTGPGIQLEPGEDLLSPFLTKKHDGTGLGLSIAHRIVTTQNGEITYGNRPEGGAWFRIVIPTEQRAAFEDA